MKSRQALPDIAYLAGAIDGFKAYLACCTAIKRVRELWQGQGKHTNAGWSIGRPPSIWQGTNMRLGWLVPARRVFYRFYLCSRSKMALPYKRTF